MTMDSSFMWILEVLAHSKQLHVSVLIDLAKTIPKSSDPVFNNLRELVSLRILESIHVQEPPLAPSTRYTIDSSETCLHLLQWIMKSSASNLKAAAAEMSKWDFQTFLKHKRSSLPPCFLVKMKEAILTGNPPHFASLREQSGLPLGNQPKPRPPPDGGGDGNLVTIDLNMSDSTTQIRSEKDQLISPVTANSKYQLPENIPAKSKISAPTKIVEKRTTQISSLVPANSKYQLPENIPAKSTISAPTKIVEKRPCEVLLTREGNVEAIMKTAKKSKPGTIYSEKQIPYCITGAPLNKPNVESSQNHFAVKENGDREGFSAIEIRDKNERLRQEQDCDVDGECDNQGQHEHEQIANVNMDELDQDIQITVPNAEEAKKGESCIAGDREMAIIAKKKAFLSSQCTPSQDSLADSFPELMICVKCNKGGNVLVCSNSCPLTIHESCMTSGMSFDKDGKFYCPFCAYSLAMEECKELMEKASAARNELLNFVSMGSRTETEKQPTSQNHLNQVDDLSKRTDLKRKAICRGKLDCEKAGPSEDGLPTKGKELGSTKGTPCTKSKHKQEKKRTKQVTHSPRVVRQRQTREQGILKSQNEIALHEISERSDELVEIRRKKGASCPTETDLHCEHKRTPSADSANEEEISEYSGDDGYNPGASGNDKRVQKNPEKQCLLRAQKVKRPWSIAEEDKLKEVMEKIRQEGYTYIPWKIILEFGAGTFHESRTATHLKDKWRNMHKAANKK